jgi:small subunit ribosomal protein S7
MPRRARVTKRTVAPDAVHNSDLVAKFINRLMIQGKKGLAERIIYDAIEIIEGQTSRNGMEVFEQAMRNASPKLEVRPRRVGGATLQVPVDVKKDRSQSLAMRWLIKAARGRNGRTMSEKLASELIDASNNTGATIKKREDTFKMAEANKAYAHYKV